MSGLRPFITGVGIIMIFGIAMYMFMIGIISQNNPDPDFLGGQNSSLSSLQDRADELQDLGESSRGLLQNAELSPTYIFVIIKAAFDIPIGFIGFFVNSIITIFKDVIWATIFGVEANEFDIVYGVLSAIVLLTIVLLILKAIRTGETER